MHQSVKKPARKTKEDLKRNEALKSADIVSQMVLNIMSEEPTNFHLISSRNVFDDKWRVNVWVEEFSTERSTPSYSVKHSFFCTIQNGEIVHSNPPIIPPEEEDGV